MNCDATVSADPPLVLAVLVAAPQLYVVTLTLALALSLPLTPTLDVGPHLGEVSRAFWRGEPSCAGLPFGGRIYSIRF